jgi:hypothetical protein
VLGELCAIAKESGNALDELCGLAKPGGNASELVSDEAQNLASASLGEKKTAERTSAGAPSLQKLEPLYLGLKSDQVRVVIQAIPELIGALQRLKTACDQPSRGRYTMCLVEITGLLKATAHVEYVVHCKAVDMGLYCFDLSDRKLGMHEEDRNFSDFLHYALFFAQMADATDGDTVKALLKSVTVPPVSYGLKRERFRTGLLLSAYVGMGFVTAATDATTKREYIVSAPIGLEVSQALSGGDSISFLLSPVDFGYPISLKLSDVDKTVKTSDIIVPGAYLFYGVKRYPVALGLGYTRVRSIENPDRRAGRVLLVVAFDLPLFSLY